MKKVVKNKKGWEKIFAERGVALPNVHEDLKEVARLFKKQKVKKNLFIIWTTSATPF